MNDIFALYCPDGVPANDPIRQFSSIQARNIFYIIRKVVGLPDLNNVIHRVKREDS
ncbi:hypothetical protein FRC01_014338, partial [Tulasnella sp. 417]